MEKKVIIKNESGLHARPAGLLVKKASEFESHIEMECSGKKINAKSIMGIMSLGVRKNSEIKIIANGEDAENAVDAIIKLIESGFGEG